MKIAITMLRILINKRDSNLQVWERLRGYRLKVAMRSEKIF